MEPTKYITITLYEYEQLKLADIALDVIIEHFRDRNSDLADLNKTVEYAGLASGKLKEGDVA